MSTHTQAIPTVLPPIFQTFRERGLPVGGGALLAGLIIAFFSPLSFFPPYLAMFLFFLGFGLGSLAFLQIHYMVGGSWGFLIRRPLEAAAMTLPVLGLLYLPILLFGMSTLYPWSNLEEAKASHIIGLKAGYLNFPFFLLRTLFYFSFWSGLAYYFRRAGIQQDESNDPSITRRAAVVAAPGMLFLFVSVTFAMVDWSMSIEPEWYSSIYAVMLYVGFGLSSLALAVIVITLLNQTPPLKDLVKPTSLHDIGNLMLAFTMLWAYMSFSQYLIMWSGNLAEEVPWYIKRSAGAWRIVCGGLIVFHFFVPFMYLLVRENKRSTLRLSRVAAWLLVVHIINDTWLIVPAFQNRQWDKLLCLIPAFLAVGGIWSYAYVRLLAGRPLVPLNDPMLAEALAHANGHAHAKVPTPAPAHAGGGH